MIGAPEEIHPWGANGSNADAADAKRIAPVLKVQRAAAIAEDELPSGNCDAHRTGRRLRWRGDSGNKRRRCQNQAEDTNRSEHVYLPARPTIDDRCLT